MDKSPRITDIERTNKGWRFKVFLYSESAKAYVFAGTLTAPRNAKRENLENYIGE
jgi:hypothetical protein